jgi:hypothetical protein
MVRNAHPVIDYEEERVMAATSIVVLAANA